MSKYISKIIYVGLIALSLSGCGTHRVNRESKKVESLISKESSLKEYLIDRRGDWTAIKASVRAEIEVGQKSYSSRVNLTAARGKGVRLSVVPFPLVEATRLWFSPEGITLVDLINGRYASEDYASLSDRLGFSLGYEQVEALFLARVFAPEVSDQSAGIQKLGYKDSPAGHKLFGSIQNYGYRFDLSPDAILHSFVVFALSTGQERFRANYSDYTEADSRAHLPQELTLELYKPNSTSVSLGKLKLQYNKVSLPENTDGLGLEVKIKPQYERIDLGQVLQLINRL